MTSSNFVFLTDLARSIRSLSIDAIDAARSGHPGLPLGCGDLLSVLYGHFLTVHPAYPNWINRDRFVLSAGHGSAGLYASLHLAGFNVSLSDLKRFRQLHSPTAGHPEYGEIHGIETTTGPLGQGLATAVGMAIQGKRLRDTWHSSIDYQVVVLAGDGCLMEGVSSEASSLAGHLRLDNLVVIYDANSICLDGPISECFTENVAARYEAYGWHVVTIDGHNLGSIMAALDTARHHQGQPTLIVATTIIGMGSQVAGSSEAHGKPLGSAESSATKQRLGIPDRPFWVADQVVPGMQSHHANIEERIHAWNRRLEDEGVSLPHLASQHPQLPATLRAIESMEIPRGIATRVASHHVIQQVATGYDPLVGGSADLSCSDSTWIKGQEAMTADHFSGRNIKFGVREFAMGAVASGLALGGVYRPFCGTFLTFSDYMKNAIRLAAMMKLPVIYQLTHDSIFLGEDGPTHQPVEHLASLRSIPQLTVFRPADGEETKAAWIHALQSDAPTALVLSRQNLPETGLTSVAGALRGAYVLQASPHARVVLLATGSEVALAHAVWQSLTDHGVATQLVSMPSWEQFECQTRDYQTQVLGETPQLRVSIEAQSDFGWHRWIGRDGVAISVNRFGYSAPASDLATEFGFTTESIIARIMEALDDSD